MKATDEMISVMTAFLQGKTIQLWCDDGVGWTDYESDDVPNWDWSHCDYRVKPENRILPYESADEFLQAQKEHGPYIKTIDGTHFLPIVISSSGFKIGTNWVEFENCCLFWQDGHVFGKEVEV